MFTRWGTGIPFLVAWLVSCSCVQGQSVCQVCGRVVDSEGRGIANVHIHAADRHTYTDSTGSYCLGPLPAGQWKLEALHLGYEATSQTLSLQSGRVQLNWLLRPHEHWLAGVTVLDDPFCNALDHVPLASIQLDSAYLRQYLAPNLMLSLGRLPGIRVASMGTGIAKPVIRGLSRNRLVIVDRGIKQEGQQWGADHGLEIDPFYAERIEILRGPSSLAYGSDAIGGVVRFEAPAPPQGPLARWTGSYQHNLRNYATTAAVALREGKWYGRLRISGQSYADIQVPADSFLYNRYILPLINNTLKNTAGNEINLTAEAGRLHDRGLADLSVSIYRQQVGLFPGAFGIPRANRLQDDGQPRNVDLPAQHVGHYKLIHRNRWQFSSWRLEIDAGLQHNDRRELAPPHAHGFQRATSSNESLALFLTTGSINLRAVHLLNPKFKSTTGLSAEAQFNRRGGYEFFLAEYDRWTGGLFHLLEYRMNSRLEWQGGLRLDGQQLSIFGHSEMIYSIAGRELFMEELVIGQTRRQAVPTWSIGLNWRAADSLMLRINGGSSFRFPQAVELAANGIHHGNFRHEMGEPSLQAERGYQLDVVSESRFGFGRMSISPYFLYFTNYLYLSPSFRFSSRPEGGQLYEYRQTEARFWGGEVLAEFQLARWLMLEIGGDYVEAHNFLTRLPLPFTPPAQGWGELKFRHQRASGRLRELSAAVECRHVGAQLRVDRNEPATPEATLWHLRAGAAWQIGSQTRMQLHGQLLNIFDALYYNHLSNYRFLNLPEPGRNLILTLSVDWTGQPRRTSSSNVSDPNPTR